MPAIATTSTLSRCIAWFLGKSSRSTSAELVEETAESCIFAPTTFKDASDTYRPQAQAFSPGAAVPQHLPLDFLELSLLCAAQGIAVIPEEPQTAVLRAPVAASITVTVVEFVEPISMAVEILFPAPTISLTPPTPTKRKPNADFRSFAQNSPAAAGTLRPSGKWHGRKHTSRRQVHDKENLPSATANRSLKTREERLKAYTPPARLLGLRQGTENTSRYTPSHRF